MKCNACGADVSENEKFCPVCGASMPGEAEGQGIKSAEESRQEEGKSAAGGQNGGEGNPLGFLSKKKKGIVIGAAAAVIVAAGAFAAVTLTAKDPKETVIAAFEQVYSEDQVKPMEELFGLSELIESAGTADVETNMALTLEDCSEEEAEMFLGSGIRVMGRNDRTNKKSQASVGAAYKGMDLVNLDVYYGEKKLMLALPGISSKAFTLDLSDGLAQRISNSPLLGPMLESMGADVEGLADYLSELSKEAEEGENKTVDWDQLMTRYKEGTQAQEKFKEAMSVEKAEKEIFSIEGKEVRCQGYQVVISKASMMEFLRTTTDFFLNDQELKDQYLKQLERSLKMTELLGGTSSGLSVDEMYQDTMEEAAESVNQVIDFLDQSLNDVNMMVYVGKKGRLAAVNGSTMLKGAADGNNSDLQLDQDIPITFDWQLQGGAYPTQNMTADVKLAGTDAMEIKLVRSGSYEGQQLTDDISLDLFMRGSSASSAGVVYTSAYNSDSGDYHIGVTAVEGGSKAKVLELSLSGVVTQLEKGALVHADIDELKLDVPEAEFNAVLSGEYYYGPMTEPVAAPEGEAFDVLAASESEWESVLLEIQMSILALANQF